MTITIGVDPGNTGAIALLDTDGLIDVYDMPVVARRISPHLLNDLENWGNEQFGMVCIEDVHAMPGNGVTGMFAFGRGLGVVEGVMAANGRPTTYVTPAVWKRDLGLLRADKGASRLRACQLWPNKAHLFARVKDDDRAEAALIAHWYATSMRRAVAS